ncbi:MAG: hypothetical protein N2170_02870 [Bacteroidia bacterium]|nr:hypothetical protein [Bacteroidia bacterium]
MQWVGIAAFLLLFGQTRVRLGADFSPQAGLLRIDTAFHLRNPTLYTWIEIKLRQPAEWDTLWVSLRTIDRLHGTFAVFRTKNDKNLYRGKIAFRQAGIYVLTITPPRQSRLLLGRVRAYIMDAQHPTIASLRHRAQKLAPPGGVSEGTLSQIDTTALEILELPSDALLPPESSSPALEEPLEEDLDSLMDIPEEELMPEEDIELDELDFGDDL